MLDVIGSIKNLQETTERHFLHIKNQHDFIRIWAIQFEIAYTDFRVIQMALQLANEGTLLSEFTQAYQAVYQFEYAFAEGGLPVFNQQFGKQMSEYEHVKNHLRDVLERIRQQQPPVTAENDLI